MDWLARARGEEEEEGFAAALKNNLASPACAKVKAVSSIKAGELMED
jgi:hypothetical protein